MHFGASPPGILPAGFEGSIRDVTVYEIEIKKKGPRNCVLVLHNALDEPVDYYEKAMKVLSKTLGNKHPLTLVVKNDLEKLRAMPKNTTY